MSDSVIKAFLDAQQTEAMELAQASDILELRPFSENQSQQYIATFHAKGMAQGRDGEIREVDRFDVGIRLPDDYLRRVDVAEVLTYLGPYRPFHPNIKAPYICLHLKPGMGLVDLLFICFELWTWKLYYTGDEGLNHEASQWARNQPAGRFPIDTRPLKRRTLQIEVQPAGKEAGQ
jgi:hypothetical protein